MEDIIDNQRRQQLISEFINTGIYHGTILEALVYALGEMAAGKSLEDALYNSAYEWYK